MFNNLAIINDDPNGVWEFNYFNYESLGYSRGFAIWTDGKCLSINKDYVRRDRSTVDWYEEVEISNATWVVIVVLEVKKGFEKVLTKELYYDGNAISLEEIFEKLRYYPAKVSQIPSIPNRRYFDDSLDKTWNKFAECNGIWRVVNLTPNKGYDIFENVEVFKTDGSVIIRSCKYGAIQVDVKNATYVLYDGTIVVDDERKILNQPLTVNCIITGDMVSRIKELCKKGYMNIPTPFDAEELRIV